MRRRPALAVLCTFTTLALLATAWGISDVLHWRAAVLRCEPWVPIDTAAVWFTGFPAVAALPLLRLTRSARAHRWMLAGALVLFIAVPQVTVGVVSQPAEAAGYRGLETLTLVPPGAVTLHTPACPDRRP
ncbi:hypothetical protein F1188_10885 [Roseospira marina]|uniref:Uncharacterized protein n=1 Tax=Roseospira marina TaxID=140057 RepID=A0A5M6IAY7_9PROT|nr:hypothetical protein [Roseospira marina]KAA5605401.1 hypothetical protein F1188_10885 [Roseospira marina]MBB4314612.1 putative membrane protein [Roseospira marina]MBB5088783.1 putative membrane protein [Roseospira marina]